MLAIRFPGRMYSNYANLLKGDVYQRYMTKINMCCGIDPYQIVWKNEPSTSQPVYPSVHFFDICEYLTETTSAYSKEKIRAIKSIESYKFFENGWVRCLNTKRLPNTNVLVFGNVSVKLMHNNSHGN